jgi:hypothetical protein
MRTFVCLQKVYLACFRMTGGMIVVDELVVGMPTPGILGFAGEMKGVVLHDEVDRESDNDDET